MANAFTVTFLAELKQVDTKKLVSGDWSRKVVFHTDDSMVENLTGLAPDVLFKVTVEVAK